MIRRLFQPRFVLAVCLVFFAGLMAWRTFTKGWDFAVFWRVAHDFLRVGSSPYDLARYGNMVFKYPPWILPIFLPLGWLALPAAKIVWGFVQGLSLAFIVRTLRRRVQPELLPRADAIQAGLLVAFAGIFVVHGIVGQTSLPMLAIALGFGASASAPPVSASSVPGSRVGSGSASDSVSASSAVFALFAMSAKTITLFPFIWVLRWSGVRARGFWGALAIFAGLALILSLPIFIRAYGGTLEGAENLLNDWWASNFSGTKAIGSIRIGFTTREAQGIPSLLLRVLPLREQESRDVLIALLTSMIAVAGWGFWRLRNLPEDVKWWGWLALTPTVQPLAWFHFFSFAYPLLVWLWMRALQPGRSRRFRSLLVLATISITMITEKTAGVVGGALELASLKSLGVLLAVFLAEPALREITFASDGARFPFPTK